MRVREAKAPLRPTKQGTSPQPHTQLPKVARHTTKPASLAGGRRHPRPARRDGARSNRYHGRRRRLPKISFARLHAFVLLLGFWLKHRLLFQLGWRGRSGTAKPQASTRGRRTGTGPRERVYVDASFTSSEIPGHPGSCGIGVWLPQRSVALALKLNAKTSMEAEILALLAGTIAARHYKVERPVIFSDCKSAVGMATRLLHVGKASGLARKLRRLAELSASHKAYGHIYDTLQSLDGTLAWRPREENREADLASNIGSRVGNMSILLAGTKNRNHALNDVLSLALNSETASNGTGLIRQRLRCGTLTVGLPPQKAPANAQFHRHARTMIAKLSKEVA